MEGISEDALRTKLQEQIGWRNGCRVTAKMLAASMEVSQAYLSDVLNGRRGIADKLADAMGYERRVIFIKRNKP